MKRFVQILTINTVLLLSVNSCISEKVNEQQEKRKPAETENLELVKKPESWITERVEKAEKKLNATEAGKVVWQSMEAHGGLKTWFQQGIISFRFDYMPINKGVDRKSYQSVDIWSNRAVHQSIEDAEDTFGWDGKMAWVKRNDTAKFPYDVRFWALTPYYFLGQPFIFDGQGVMLEKLKDESFEGQQYDVVKVMFEAGTGDAPDDYYINYYNKKTHLLKVIRYIVSYPSYFKDGGHSPEKMMVVKGYDTVKGITLANAYETFSMNDDQSDVVEKVTEVKVSRVSFDATVENSFFAMPEGATEVK